MMIYHQLEQSKHISMELNYANTSFKQMHLKCLTFFFIQGSIIMVVPIHPSAAQVWMYFQRTGSYIWLLMSWLLASPSHQQLSYWLSRINRPYEEWLQLFVSCQCWQMLKSIWPDCGQRAFNWDNFDLTLQVLIGIKTCPKLGHYWASSSCLSTYYYFIISRYRALKSEGVYEWLP